MNADACWCCGEPLDLEGECPEGCCDGCEECCHRPQCCVCYNPDGVDGEEDEFVEEDEDA